MITIAIIVLIAAIGSMSIENMNRNAFAGNSHHNHHHGDNDGNHRHVCIDHHDRHVCIDDRHGSSDDQQEEIILSSPGLTQQQLYLNHIYIDTEEPGDEGQPEIPTELEPPKDGDNGDGGGSDGDGGDSSQDGSEE
jgi:hypothetical protein